MIKIFKDIDAILKEYGVKSFKVTRGEYIAIRKNGEWHYFNWNDKAKGLIKTGESQYLERSTVQNVRKK
jgi:hypothetical protein